MLWNVPAHGGGERSPWVRRIGLAGLCLAGWFSNASFAQELGQLNQPSDPSIGGIPLGETLLPVTPPRPTEGPRAVERFVDTISNQTPDGFIEVVLGRPRLLTLKEDLGQGDQFAQVSLGDPSVADVGILNARQFRITGHRAGVTDLVISTPGGETYIFRIQVVYDLDVLRAQLAAIFPDAQLRLGQIREHVVIEGQARDTAQVARVLEVARAYLTSMLAQMEQQSSSTAQDQAGTDEDDQTQQTPDETGDAPPEEGADGQGQAAPEEGRTDQIRGAIATPQLINLITVPGTQQVCLKVRIMELNRTGLREVGARFITDAAGGPNFFSSLIGNAANAAIPSVVTAPGGANGSAVIQGVSDNGNFAYVVSALRRNNLTRILAEPNLVTMSGHQASFLAGGEIAIPVPQPGSGGASITVEFRPFGAQLGFLPFVMDHERIRLTLRTEVSQPVGGTALAGFVVPNFTTRRAETTVDLKQGQTLSIAGLLQVINNGTISRIPGIGDLPVIGPMFSNNNGQRQELELVIAVSPYLVEPMNQDQVPHGPGDEIVEPNDLEFFLLGRLEGRTGRDFRSTTNWDNRWDLVRILNLEKRSVRGPSGFSN